MHEFQQSDVPTACLGPAPNFKPYDRPADYLIANCNPWANRQPGDFIFVWDQQGKSSTVAIIKRTFLYNDTSPANGAWDGPISEPLFLDAGVQLSSLNPSQVAATVADDGLGGEAAINLSAFVFPPSSQQTSCFTVGNVIPGTVTGNSDTADYKDTVLRAFTDFVNISNCGSLRITKLTDPSNDTGSFPFTVQRLGGGNMFYAAPPAAPPLTDTSLTTVGGTFTKNGDSVQISDLIVWPSPSYTLTEGGLSPSAWQAQVIECRLEGETTRTWTWTRNPSNPNDSSTVTFEVEPSATTECTIRNKRLRGSLRVIKLVSNDNGGIAVPSDFTISLGDDPQNPTVINGAGSVNNEPNPPSFFEKAYDDGQAFRVVEIGGAPGYQASYAGDCEGVIEAGVTKTCTITNNDLAPSLTLVKTVTNDGGGTAVTTDFTLSANGPTPISGAGGATSPATFAAGTYTLNETSLPGYAASAWSCAGGTQNGSQITLGLGQSATCTITNDDMAASLTLVKVVTNDNGGTAKASDFVLAASGPTGFSGAGPSVSNAVNFEAGTYTLSETGPAGYAASAWSCVGATLNGSQITLGLGQSATCTITNDDMAPSLTLVKEIINHNGGTAKASDFVLTASGPTGFSGAGPSVGNGASFEAGTYTLSETGPAGYTASAWSCVGATPNGSQITLGLGQSPARSLTTTSRQASRWSSQ